MAAAPRRLLRAAAATTQNRPFQNETTGLRSQRSDIRWPPTTGTGHGQNQQDPNQAQIARFARRKSVTYLL
jgi:hypothetical protein